MPFIRFNLYHLNQSAVLATVVGLLMGLFSTPPLQAANSSGNSAEYQRLMGQLSSLESRVEEATERLQDLVNKKNASRSPKEREVLIEQMVEEHQQTREQVAEYNRLRNEIRFRFPAQGQEIDLLFGPRRPPSMEELEQSSSLDARLDRVQETFLRHYGSVLREQEEAEHQQAEGEAQGSGRRPASEPDLEKSRPRLKLSR